MNYEKLKNLTRIKGLTIKTLAGAVGLTDAGFHKSIKENSFRVDTLEKCAEVLDITVCYFFDCEPGD